jgi:sugar diacid utilization regulator
MQAINADLCLIILREQTDNHLRIRTCVPDLSDKSVIVQSTNIDGSLWERLHKAAAQGRLPRLNMQELEAINPLKNVQYETLLLIPLIVGEEYIGLMECYSSRTLQCNDEDQLMLCAIANQAALAIKHQQHIEKDMLAQQTIVKAFIKDLLCVEPEMEDSLSRRAYALGCDLTKPHAVVLIELSALEVFSESHIQPDRHAIISTQERLELYANAAADLEHCIQGHYPGSLVDERDNILVCLLCLGNESAFEFLGAWLDDLLRRIQDERHVRMCAAIGNLCHTLSDYRRGYAEANEALDLGRHLNAKDGSTYFNALGAYRYIYKFAYGNTLRDQYQDQIASIVEYDRRKKTNLLDTLEIYLEYGGNVARTSNRLELHRNTLLQRLERLRKLSSLDVEQVQNRLSLLLAIKIHKLRAGCIR